MFKKSISGSSSAIAICLAMTVGMNAQAAYAQTEPENAGVTDIVVTALKRSESIQKIPATIAAFSQEDLETRHIQGLSDLITQVPSLRVGYTFGSNTITLRGISTNLTSGFEDPSVAVHVNGVYQARARSLNLALMDLERVEVLSGPQGTLYGRNATGGVINYVLRRPSKEPEAEVTANVGNYETYGVRAYVSGPFSDTVGFRIAGLISNRDKGFTKNVLAGAPKSRFDENKVAGIRAVLAFEPTDALQIDLEGSFSNTRSSFVPTVLSPALNPARVVQLGAQSFRPRTIAANFPASNKTKDYAASGTIRWAISDKVSLTSISAYQKYDNHMNNDGDASPSNLQLIFNQIHTDTFTQEVNINADLFDDRLHSIFGAYYFHDNAFAGTQQFSDLGGTLAQNFNGRNYLRSRSVAFFTDQTFSVTDRLRLIGGVRYNIDKKKTRQILSSCGNVETFVDQKFTAWTPKGGIQYDVADNVMMYGNYQKGFKAGGVGAGTCANAYEPETIEGFEVGVKTKLFDNRVRLNVAGYWYDYGNLQVQKTLGTAGGFAVSNAAKSRIKGIEANLDAALTSRFQINISAMVQSAKYTNFINCNNREFLGACSAIDPRPANDPSRFQQLSGNWLNRAAPYSINLGAQYTFDVAGGDLLLRGESFWSGKVHFNEFASPSLIQRAYSVQNAFLTYTPEGKKFDLRLFIKNIADKDHYASAYFGGFNTQDQFVWDNPRTFGAEFAVRF